MCSTLVSCPAFRPSGIVARAQAEGTKPRAKRTVGQCSPRVDSTGDVRSRRPARRRRRADPADARALAERRGLRRLRGRRRRLALAQVERSLPDVIVLDVAMPGIDGLAVTRRLRAKGLPVPILLLTARDALYERVAGLDAGADDYLVKPFEIDELTARIRALLRRNHAPDGAASHARVRRPRARPRQRDRAARRPRPRAHPPRGGAARAAAAQRARRRHARARARRGLGRRGRGGRNVVDRYVAYLRRKLGDPPLIHTVRGVGFRLDGWR